MQNDKNKNEGSAWQPDGKAGAAERSGTGEGASGCFGCGLQAGDETETRRECN